MEKMNSWIVAHTPMRRAGNPGELDSTVCFLAADESSYVTGAIVPLRRRVDEHINLYNKQR